MHMNTHEDTERNKKNITLTQNQKPNILYGYHSEFYAQTKQQTIVSTVSLCALRRFICEEILSSQTVQLS